jgi:hypothetical protein
MSSISFDSYDIYLMASVDLDMTRAHDVGEGGGAEASPPDFSLCLRKNHQPPTHQKNNREPWT